MPLKKIEDYLKKIEVDNDDASTLAQKVYDTVYEYMSDKKNEENNIIPNANQINNANQDNELNEFLYALKEKAAKLAIENDEVDLGNDNNAKFLKEFMYDPIDAMEQQLDSSEEYYDELAKEQKAGKLEADRDYEELALLSTQLKSDLLIGKDSYNEFVRNKKDTWKEKQDLRAAWFNNYFNNGKPKIEESLANNKGGFFENLFNTTSKEYKEFAKNLENVTNDGPKKGDLSGLRQSAFAYMKHKFKGKISITGNDYIFSGDAFDKLDKTSQGRIRLCQAVLDSIKQAEHDAKCGYNPSSYKSAEESKIDEVAIIEAHFFGKLADDTSFESAPGNNIIDEKANKDMNKLKSNDFQNGIKKDVDDIVIGNNNIIQDDNNIINNEIENSKN